MSNDPNKMDESAKRATALEMTKARAAVGEKALTPIPVPESELQAPMPTPGHHLKGTPTDPNKE